MAHPDRAPGGEYEAHGGGRLKVWLLLLAAVGCEVGASLSLKGAFERPLLVAPVVIGYLGAFVLLDAVLRTGFPLGVAYGIWGAVGVAATGVLSAIVYDEPLNGLMAFGLVAIVGGVLLIEFGSHYARARVDGR